MPIAQYDPLKIELTIKQVETSLKSLARQNRRLFSKN